MSRKTEAKIMFVGVLIFLVISVFNLFTLTHKADIAGTILFMVIGLVALCGLWNEMKNDKRWRN